MAITKPRRPTNPDEFIGGAPDSSLPAAPSSPGVPEISIRSPKAKRGTNRLQVSVVLATELVAKLDQQAERKYMSRSAYITMALNEYLSRTD